jgi:hypothetical protein
VPRGQVRLGDAAHESLVPQSMRDDLRDRDERDVVLAREHLEIGAARHRAVRVHDLADHADRWQSSEAREVHRGLRLTDAAQHAARHRAQRKDVPGTHQVGGTRGFVHEQADRCRTIRRADARRHTEARMTVYRDGERGALRFRVLLGHRREVERVRALVLERDADQPAAVRRHEIDHLGRDRRRRTDEVALVLAILVVRDDHQPARADLLDRALNRVECHSILQGRSPRCPRLCRHRRELRASAGSARPPASPPRPLRRSAASLP